MNERRRLEGRQPLGRASPGGMQALQREHTADDLLAPHRLGDPGVGRGELGVEMGQFRPQPAGGDCRRLDCRQPFEERVAPHLNRLEGRHGRVVGVESAERVPQVGEHAGDLRPVESAGELVQPAASPSAPGPSGR